MTALTDRRDRERWKTEKPPRIDRGGFL